MFDYDADTGILSYSHNHLRSDYRGNVAGCINPHGYLRVSITVDKKRTLFMAHRIIWKMHYGNDPDTIDHINFDTTDNRLCNLRDVTQCDNNKHNQKYYQRGMVRHRDREHINAYNRAYYSKHKRKGVKGYRGTSSGLSGNSHPQGVDLTPTPVSL